MVRRDCVSEAALASEIRLHFYDKLLLAQQAIPQSRRRRQVSFGARPRPSEVSFELSIGSTNYSADVRSGRPSS